MRWSEIQDQSGEKTLPSLPLLPPPALVSLLGLFSKSGIVPITLLRLRLRPPGRSKPTSEVRMRRAQERLMIPPSASMLKSFISSSSSCCCSICFLVPVTFFFSSFGFPTSAFPSFPCPTTSLNSLPHSNQPHHNSLLNFTLYRLALHIGLKSHYQATRSLTVGGSSLDRPPNPRDASIKVQLPEVNRNQRQYTTFAVHFVPGTQFVAFDFGGTAAAERAYLGSGRELRALATLDAFLYWLVAP